jgi:hypothetical protein
MHVPERWDLTRYDECEEGEGIQLDYHVAEGKVKGPKAREPPAGWPSPVKKKAVDSNG